MHIFLDAFDEIKCIVACDALLTYPDFNETFKMYINARKFQIRRSHHTERQTDCLM